MISILNLMSNNKVDGREYEIGGSIIHSANKLMVDYMDICKQFGIKKKQPTPDAPFSLHRDGEIVFQVASKPSREGRVEFSLIPRSGDILC